MTWELANEANWGLVLVWAETGESFYLLLSHEAALIAGRGDEHRPCPRCTDGHDPVQPALVCAYCMGVRLYPRLAAHQDHGRYTGNPDAPLRYDGLEPNPPAPSPALGSQLDMADGVTG